MNPGSSGSGFYQGKSQFTVYRLRCANYSRTSTPAAAERLPACCPGTAPIAGPRRVLLRQSRQSLAAICLRAVHACSLPSSRRHQINGPSSSSQGAASTPKHQPTRPQRAPFPPRPPRQVWKPFATPQRQQLLQGVCGERPGGEIGQGQGREAEEEGSGVGWVYSGNWPANTARRQP